LDLETAQESIVPRILPGVGDWSKDGQQILFTDVLAAENEPYVDVYIVDLVSNDVRPAFGKEVTDTDFSQPRWMPGGEWVAASLRPVNANINKALWVIRLEDAFGIPISEDLSASYSSYQWDPWGNHLVYQRLELSSSDAPASVWLWDWEARQPRLLVERGARPAWLP
jgi:Tol biopolymer transport system component